ncbi:hypothetical protein [Motilibacter deserti]|uniref:Antitoxin VbhA domain-containing protein n=1 Tax=Motilibacter deserti TaxID=2714956 RepID=A0ABX0GSR8_9ACTN|nr:hypothetical protein [Motilibacter deserti]NHC12810.1 hypothetical protein [Motilibacter deserti]
MSIIDTTTARTRLAQWRAARDARLRLERELGAYVTAADRAEIDAIVGRHTVDEAREVEAILTEQAVERAHRGAVAA